nr:MAG TPA: hypothetical protein [Caudoviricetes sp.]
MSDTTLSFCSFCLVAPSVDRMQTIQGLVLNN